MRAPGLEPTIVNGVDGAVSAFSAWLETFGETSYDHQTIFAGPVGRRAKALYYRHRALGTAAVAPMIFCEAFAPRARRFFAHPVRFPIADAHYAMGFAYRAHADGDDCHARAVHFLEALTDSRSPGFAQYCWGYPFDWVTRNGTIPAGTPMITSTPYAYEAFRQVYAIDQNDRWRQVCRSIAGHALTDIKDFAVSRSASACSYTPYDRGGVVNAAAYRACLLACAAADFADDAYWHVGERNLNFVLGAQQDDGSWFYSVDGQRDFVDHFHTCFVLKGLAKIEHLTGHAGCRVAIARGVEYYLQHLFDSDGLPRPFSRAPRLTVYRRELYDYAECINLCLLLRDRFEPLAHTLQTVVADLLARWVKPDGSFRSRELLVGWDEVPMHRWAQSQIFRSLAFLLNAEGRTAAPASHWTEDQHVRHLRAV